MFRHQGFLSCSHKGNPAHCLTDLGCCISQEDPCPPKAHFSSCCRGVCLQPCPWLTDGSCCCHSPVLPACLRAVGQCPAVTARPPPGSFTAPPLPGKPSLPKLRTWWWYPKTHHHQNPTHLNTSHTAAPRVPFLALFFLQNQMKILLIPLLLSPVATSATSLLVTSCLV